MAIDFTGNHNLYGFYMNQVIDSWKISCENAFTDELLNKKAWIGHAACALALSCPENITRKAWGLLSDEQRYLANEQAEKAIQRWRLSYIKGGDLHKDVGQQVLL